MLRRKIHLKLTAILITYKYRSAAKDRESGPATICARRMEIEIMWPYTQDEVTWLALPHERAAMERTQRIIDRHWMKQVGVLRQPANDIVGETRAAGR